MMGQACGRQTTLLQLFPVRRVKTFVTPCQGVWIEVEGGDGSFQYSFRGIFDKVISSIPRFGDSRSPTNVFSMYLCRPPMRTLHRFALAVGPLGTVIVCKVGQGWFGASSTKVHYSPNQQAAVGRGLFFRLQLRSIIQRAALRRRPLVTLLNFRFISRLKETASLSKVVSIFKRSAKPFCRWKATSVTKIHTGDKKRPPSHGPILHILQPFSVNAGGKKYKWREDRQGTVESESTTREIFFSLEKG